MEKVKDVKEWRGWHSQYKDKKEERQPNTVPGGQLYKSQVRAQALFKSKS